MCQSARPASAWRLRLRAGRGRLFVRPRQTLLGDNGKTGIHRPDDLSYPGQGPDHGPLLWPLRQLPPGQGQEGEPCSTALRMVEEELRRIPSKGWATMIRKVYEVDPATGTSRRGSEADRWRHFHPGAPATFGRH